MLGLLQVFSLTGLIESVCFPEVLFARVMGTSENKETVIQWVEMNFFCSTLAFMHVVHCSVSLRDGPKISVYIRIFASLCPWQMANPSWKPIQDTPLDLLLVRTVDVELEDGQRSDSGRQTVSESKTWLIKMYLGSLQGWKKLWATSKRLEIETIGKAKRTGEVQLCNGLIAALLYQRVVLMWSCIEVMQPCATPLSQDADVWSLCILERLKTHSALVVLFS